MRAIATDVFKLMAWVTAGAQIRVPVRGRATDRRPVLSQLYFGAGIGAGCPSRNSSKDSLGITSCSPFLEAATAVPPAAPASTPIAAPVPPPAIPKMARPIPRHQTPSSRFWNPLLCP
jgi:hypothetical protein